MLLALHRARTSHQRKVATADPYPTDIDDGVVGMGFTTCELEAFLHTEDTLDLRERIKRFQVLVGAFVTDRRDDRLCGTVDWRGFIAEFDDFLDDFLDKCFGSVWADDDDHWFFGLLGVYASIVWWHIRYE